MFSPSPKNTCGWTLGVSSSNHKHLITKSIREPFTTQFWGTWTPHDFAIETLVGEETTLQSTPLAPHRKCPDIFGTSVDPPQQSMA